MLTHSMNVMFTAQTQFQEEDELFNITNVYQPPFATIVKLFLIYEFL